MCPRSHSSWVVQAEIPILARLTPRPCCLQPPATWEPRGLCRVGGQGALKTDRMTGGGSAIQDSVSFLWAVRDSSSLEACMRASSRLGKELQRTGAGGRDGLRLPDLFEPRGSYKHGIKVALPLRGPYGEARLDPARPPICGPGNGRHQGEWWLLLISCSCHHLLQVIWRPWL